MLKPHVAGSILLKLKRGNTVVCCCFPLLWSKYHKALTVAWVMYLQEINTCGIPQVFSEAFCYPAAQQPTCQRKAAGGTLNRSRACTGKAQPGRKATANTDFWPKWLFAQREGCQPGQAGLSSGCSKATDVPLMVKGWVVCSVSLLSRFLEDRRDLSELGSIKQIFTCR